jgi:hypothetical protein
MRAPSSELVLSRARRYAAGESRAAIAYSDGVGRPRVLDALRRVVREAAESLTPGSALPSCAYWHDRANGTWYVSVDGIPRPADVAWALATIESRGPLGAAPPAAGEAFSWACPECGTLVTSIVRLGRGRTE